MPDDRNPSTLPSLPEWLRQYNIAVGPYDQPVAPAPPAHEPREPQAPAQPVAPEYSRGGNRA